MILSRERCTESRGLIAPTFIPKDPKGNLYGSKEYALWMSSVWKSTLKSKIVVDS